MPELADVEGFRRVLTEHAIDRPVRSVEVFDGGVLRATTAGELRHGVTGRRLRAPRRHGKWLIVPISGGAAMLMHFGMTGALTWSTVEEPRHAHDRVVFRFRGGELRYRDQRKLTGIRLVAGEADAADDLDDLGPDACTVSRDEFAGRLATIRRGCKAALTDQSVIAGLGNLLADEILWRARIHPRRGCADLDRSQLTRLHARMATVLRAATKAGRVPPRKSWLTGHRDEPDACPRCGTQLRYGRINGRGTVWCPNCQRDSDVR
ncbi:MAG TPA: DNA-formamidopyrimidine glycosylase family protein [Pseudonocardiaceae bacterium]|jgi:formamidopyrimidine-DNA glycosylase